MSWIGRAVGCVCLAIAPASPFADSATPNLDHFERERSVGRVSTAVSALERLDRLMAGTLEREGEEIVFFTRFGEKTLNCNQLLYNHGNFRLEPVRELTEHFESMMERCTLNDYLYIEMWMDSNRARTNYLLCRMWEERRLSITEYLLYAHADGEVIDTLNPVPSDLGDIAEVGWRRAAQRSCARSSRPPPRARPRPSRRPR